MAQLNSYLDWDDNMIVSDVGKDDSYDHATFIRNPRKVCTCERPLINRNRSGHENFSNRCGGGGGGRSYEDINDGGENGYEECDNRVVK